MPEPKPYLEKRPWGHELWLTDQKPSMVKILVVEPGESLSLQYHHSRDEFWLVLEGDGEARIGDAIVTLGKGSQCFVSRESLHQLRGGKSQLSILELAFGEFDEKDIVRLEDRYGRPVSQ